MTTKFDIDNYAQLNTDINTLFRTGLYSHVAISLFTDEAGTTPYNCPGGFDVTAKKIKKVAKNAAYKDATTGADVRAKICVEFDDDTMCECINPDTGDLWYKLEGVAIVRRRF
jgi:hypothetical protein|tara:strand:+ start:246 stop:584 length:339 start_codon:yes stop_codon:yes gene_type:complete